jgi:hypothetical protein
MEMSIMYNIEDRGGVRNKSLSGTMLSVEKKEKNAERSFFIQKQNERLASTVPTCRNQCILVMASYDRRIIPRVRDVPSAWHGCLRSSPVRYLLRFEACWMIVVRKNLKEQRPAWVPLREPGFH